ncbi:hypothetical protein B0T22DRAFT_494789 [Podospora appendiculata]|uniref:Uncharacterized protein n=1 Tax=Podospora appendiculata TaxID=314037 RepID=A0AAE1C7Q6_9PEZI|nr:hypothetical protein B0T22DRAFT_494789 [Podospora appendiculata]
MVAPQLGDLVRFAEFGWMVYDYGWSRERNASIQYIEFGGDVEHLAKCLNQLSGVVTQAQSLFCDPHQSLPPVGALDWDNATLLDIIGDYDATLNECLQLVKTNRSYTATTGPVPNLVWNVMVQPKVDRLRARIALHSAKIQHVLEPFKIDLYLRIHSDLARRIQGVQDDVRDVGNSVKEMQRELQTLMCHLNPALVQNMDPQSAREIPRIEVPAPIWQSLEQGFVDRDADRLDNPPLRDIADAFITNFEMSTRHFRPAPNQGITSPPLRQYLALVTCQFLMDKMFESPEYHSETQTSSHWPRYIKSLQQHLSAECGRFNQDMTPPDILGPDGSLSVPAIWKREELTAYIESANIPTAMEHLLYLPLQKPHPQRWRRLKLLRISDGTDRQFRLVITAGDQGRPASETRPVNFDIRNACLIPCYATHDGRDAPLEMVLRVGDELHPLVFCSRADLYRFQQALTGYEVVDQYMEYGLQVVFVMGADGKVMEYATLQLWRPSRLEGERVVGDGEDEASQTSSTSSSETLRLSRSVTDPIPFSPGGSRDSWSSYAMQTRSDPLLRAQAGEGPAAEGPRSPTDPSFTAWQPQRTNTDTTIRQQGRLSVSRNSGQARNMPPSPTSPVSSPTNVDPSGRQNSLPNGTLSTAGSMRSSISTASYATRSVSVVGTSNVAATGMLHCKPTEPLLVLFTQSGGGGNTTNAHGIVAVVLDHTTGCNYSACQCISRPECRIASLERPGSGGGSRPLTLLRLGGTPPPLGASPTSRSKPAQWDILPLSEPLRSSRATSRGAGKACWRRVIRISICFESTQLRRHFAGVPCTCPQAAVTEGQLMACLARWHRGRLGLAQEAARREWADWHRMRFGSQVGIVVDQRLMPGRG